MMTEKAAVLIVDDDPELAELMVDCLEKAGFEASHARDGEEGLRRLWELRPNLVTVDLLMPRLDGWGLVQRIREVTDIPVIVVSVKQDIEDKLQAFDLGIDDFIAKPFSMQEFLARVKARLRRIEEAAPVPIVCGPLVVDPRAQELWKDSTRVHLTPTEFRLLRYFVDNRGKTLSRRQLLAKVWGTDDEDLLPSVKVYVFHLRRKIEDDPAHPKLIVSAPYRRGYMFVA